MADTVLKSVTIRNWTTVRSAEIVFPERGLILVRGNNTAAKGKMASIGSGKTALGEALSRALFEVPGRYTQLGNFSTKGKGNTYVKVACEHKGKPLLVEMGFKCEELNPGGEGLRFTYADQQIARDRIDNTRLDLLKLLTVPTDLASWTVYLDGDKLKFSDLSEKKAVELLMSALMQAPWTQFLKQANTTVSGIQTDLDTYQATLDQAKTTASETETELEVAKTNLAGAKTVYENKRAALQEELNTVQVEITQVTTNLAARKTKMTEIKKEIDRRIKATAAKEHKLEIAVNERQDALDTIREEQAELRTHETACSGDHRRAVNDLNQAKSTPENCPTCGQKYPCPDESATEKLEKAVTAAKAKLTKATAAVAAKAKLVEAAVKALQEAKTTLQEAKSEMPVDDLSQEYEDLEGEVADDNTALASAERKKAKLEHGPDKTDITRFTAVVEEREQQLTKAQENVNASALNLAETEEALRVAEYWQEAFGPSGIPNMVLRDALTPLNTTAKRISSLLTGGSIGVSYDTSRELASGKQRSELVIKVKNDLGSHRFDGSSKGESGLTELIVAETLAEVGGIANRIGYRWYDEVCPNQDEIVRRSIYAYLGEIARRYGILVFLVSHAPEAASYADYILVAEKSAEGTTYRWENR